MEVIEKEKKQKLKRKRKKKPQDLPNKFYIFSLANLELYRPEPRFCQFQLYLTLVTNDEGTMSDKSPSYPC